jgi:putative aminopeptidase FrvX
MIQQVAEKQQIQPQQQAGQRVQCDSCSARAVILVDLPYGTLSFCNHHYNKNSVALTDQGGIAKLLDSLEKDLGEL